MVPWLLPVFPLFYLLILNCAPIGVECKRSQPHILFMLADDLGWIDVGFHGSKIHTPNIDSLAKDGVILDNFYAQPVCTPARGALMTGRYPIHTGKEKRLLSDQMRLTCLPRQSEALRSHFGRQTLKLWSLPGPA